MKPIYHYLDYRTYLRDLVDALKTKQRSFSYRYFSRKVGFSSPNFLLLVLQGKRNLSADSMDRFAQFFKLGNREQKFFELLVNYNQAATSVSKQQFYEQMLGFSAFSKVYHLAREQYDFLSKWYYPAILELIQIPALPHEPHLLAKKLRHEISAKQVNEALAALQKLGFIKINGVRYVACNQAISTGDEVRSLAAVDYHKQILDLAKTSIEAQEPKQRELSALTFAIATDRLPKIKTLIREFNTKLINILSEPTDNADAVYQLSIQMFALSELVTKKKTE